MRFDLHYRWLNPRHRNYLAQLLQSDIREADRPAGTVVDEALQRLPRLRQRDPFVVDHVTVLVSRILIVTRLKRIWRMDQIAIDIVHLQSAATGIERGPDPLWTMIGVPQLRGEEHVFPPKCPGLECFAHRFTHRFFIAVTLCAIEMSETHSQCSLDGLLGLDRIRNQRAESDNGDRTRSVGELNP